MARFRRLGGMVVSAVLALVASSARAEQVPIQFEEAPMEATSDPTGLWTDEELAESRVAALPPVAYATFPVDGGEATLAILQGAWCGAADCPYRFRLETDGGAVLHSHGAGDYGMTCQSTDFFSVDPIDLVVQACGQTIDLKAAR